jgi:hypothetical protein
MIKRYVNIIDMSNLAINQEEKRKSFKLQKEECSEGSVKNDKENTSQAANLKSPEIVGTSAPRVGSAIDMIKATKVTTVVIEKHTTAVIGRPPVIVTKPPSAEPVAAGHKQRTVSSSAAVIPAPLVFDFFGCFRINFCRKCNITYHDFFYRPLLVLLEYMWF